MENAKRLKNTKNEKYYKIKGYYQWKILKTMHWNILPTVSYDCFFRTNSYVRSSPIWLLIVNVIWSHFLSPNRSLTSYRLTLYDTHKVGVQTGHRRPSHRHARVKDAELTGWIPKHRRCFKLSWREDRRVSFDQASLVRESINHGSKYHLAAWDNGARE